MIRNSSDSSVECFDRISIKYNDDGTQQLIIRGATMDDQAEYSVLTDKGMKCSCKVTVKEAEKKPELKLDKTDFQGDAGRPFTIEIPYKGEWSFIYFQIQCFSQ